MAFLEALAFLVERCGDLALGGAACEARDFFFGFLAGVRSNEF